MVWLYSVVFRPAWSTMCHMTQPSCILREIFILRCSIICLFAYYYYCDSVAVALLFSTNATCQYRLLLCFHGVLNVPGVPVTSHCLCPAPWGICACKYGLPWQILCLPLAPLTAGTDTGWQPSGVQMVTVEYCVFIVSGVPTDVSMAFACAVNSRGGDERRAPAQKWG